MPPQNLIVLVVDGLHAGMLGAYGNSWIRTTHLDRLAAEAFVLDQAYCDSVELHELYRAFWLGKPARDASDDTGAASLARVLTQRGWQTCLVADEPSLLNEAGSDFAVELPMADRGRSTEPQLDRLFDVAIDWLTGVREPFAMWLHARGMYGLWDAPYAYREKFADVEDPPPPDFIEPPNRHLPANFDADELLGIAHAYAGQVALLDECVGQLLDYLQSSGRWTDTAIALVGARGFPLGEHRRVGLCDRALYNELTQLAWFMRFPDELGKLARSQALVQPADLPGTLVDWLKIDRAAAGFGHSSSLLPVVCGTAESIRPYVVMQSDEGQALRTAAWLLRVPASGTVELYSKPSDRWEVNEVAKLCPEIVAGLEAVLQQAASAVADTTQAPLDEALVTEID